jgi:hypothetical protein
VCASCNQDWPRTQFTKAQLAKAPTVRKCKDCQGDKSDGAQVNPVNFIASEYQGCHVAVNRTTQSWVIAPASPFSRADFGLPKDCPVPDISIDPETRVLTVINSEPQEVRCYFITCDHPCKDRSGKLLQMGWWSQGEDNAQKQECLTLIVMLAPKTMIDVCEVMLKKRETVENVFVSSDVQCYVPHPSPAIPADCLRFNRFPLQGDGPFLCSQGCGGCLTVSAERKFHFFGFFFSWLN